MVIWGSTFTERLNNSQMWVAYSSSRAELVVNGAMSAAVAKIHFKQCFAACKYASMCLVHILSLSQWNSGCGWQSAEHTVSHMAKSALCLLLVRPYCQPSLHPEWLAACVWSASLVSNIQCICASTRNQIQTPITMVGTASAFGCTWLLSRLTHQTVCTNTPNKMVACCDNHLGENILVAL